ncbi:hypothetical protein EST38_g6255 [Candolleomyces aberdarensis]|uniref:Nephrocystin 3-like N-terminal domain-containing protein n=1 Tax=Candolleomyces aberdarensis TaxID=2316362 RepID=A0A4Q2DI14_9AGAR|nr:hypothetical protein EST38_g6255 [Candolleomyces aberdarensis]
MHNPSLLDCERGGVSFNMQMQCLVFRPFRMAWEGGFIPDAMAKDPFLIVVDGLDECKDKHEVQEFIKGLVAFCKENPKVPLRVFLTSRMERHIQCHLDVPGVYLENLVDLCTEDDITAFFESEVSKGNEVIESYASKKHALFEFSGGSFISALAAFQFILKRGAKGLIAHLPQSLKTDLGLDWLYAEILARSERLPHFLDIMSTLALLRRPLTVSEIAELLGIESYKVANVLVNLQAIIPIPATDSIPVSLYHTSLHSFLTTKRRSGRFFAHPSFHVHLFFSCLKRTLMRVRFRLPQDPFFIHPIHRSPAVEYSFSFLMAHFKLGEAFFCLLDFDSAIPLLNEALDLSPYTTLFNDTLAEVQFGRFKRTSSISDLEQAISHFRETVQLRPVHHLDYPSSLGKLTDALIHHSQRMGSTTGLKEAISLCRKALRLRSSKSSDASALLLDSLGNSLFEKFRLEENVADLEEAISVYLKALELHPRRVRSLPLYNVGNALLKRYYLPTGTIKDLEDAIGHCLEALKLRTYESSRHPIRLLTLNNLATALLERYRHPTGTIEDVEVAIRYCHEALLLRYPNPAWDRSLILNTLGTALMQRSCHPIGTSANLQEAISHYHEALELRPSFHPDRSVSLTSLGNALLENFRLIRSIPDLAKAIALFREAIEIAQSSHRDHLALSCDSLGNALFDRYLFQGAPIDLEKAIYHYREALELRPPPHPKRWVTLKNLAQCLVAHYHHAEGTIADIEEAVPLFGEAFSLLPEHHVERPVTLTSLATSLQTLRAESPGSNCPLPCLPSAKEYCIELAFRYSAGREDGIHWMNMWGILRQTCVMDKNDLDEPTKEC